MYEITVNGLKTSKEINFTGSWHLGLGT